MIKSVIMIMNVEMCHTQNVEEEVESVDKH